MQKPDIQQLIGNTLRRGVTLACVLAALGGLYYLIAHGADAVPDYRHFDPHTAAAQTDYTSLMGIVRGVAALNAHSCIQLGVVALILTPILRVVLSLFDFALERDWLYAAITAIVLAVIVVNSIGGSDRNALLSRKTPRFPREIPFFLRQKRAARQNPVVWGAFLTFLFATDKRNAQIRSKYHSKTLLYG